MVKAYAVNWSDAWPIPDDEPKEGHYVKYEDYAAMSEDRDYWYALCLAAGILDDGELP